MYRCPFMMKSFITFLLATNLVYIPVHANEQTEDSGKPSLEKLESAVTVSVPANQSVLKLGDIKKIFIASFGTGEGVEVIRDKVINRLLKSDLVVADSADEADAILSGSAQTNSGLGVSFNRYSNGASSYSAELVVRLTGKKHDLLWTDEIKSNWAHSGSSAKAGSNVADKLIKELCKAISKDKKATQISYSR